MTFKMFVLIDALLFMLLLLIYGNSADVQQQPAPPEQVKIATIDTKKDGAIDAFWHGFLGQKMEIDTHTKSK